MSKSGKQVLKSIQAKVTNLEQQYHAVNGQLSVCETAIKISIDRY